MISNVLVQVSPMPQVQEWEGKGTTGAAEPAPYISMGLNGWQWCSYAIAAWILTGNSGYLVLLGADCLGALLGSYYTVVFCRNCRNAETAQSLRQYAVVVACLVVPEICIWLFLPPTRALLLHSFIAGACGFASASSLLASLPTVFRTGDFSGICAPLVAAKLVSASLWIYWATTMNEPVILAVNMLSLTTSCVCLYARCFPKRREACRDLLAEESLEK